MGFQSIFAWKPWQKRLLSKMQLLMFIDLNMNPSSQDGFIVAQDRSFLKPRPSGKSGTSQIVAFEHAKASAALAASCKRASRKSRLARRSSVSRFPQPDFGPSMSSVHLQSGNRRGFLGKHSTTFGG